MSARFQRRASGAHIVNQQHGFPPNRGIAKSALPYREGPGDVRATPIGRKLDLSARCATPAKSFHHRRAQVTRDFVSLIESAPVFASPMQRDRHDAVGVRDDLSTSMTHLSGERHCKRQPAGILERVDDLSQRSFVFANCASPGNGRRLIGTIRTAGVRPG